MDFIWCCHDKLVPFAIGSISLGGTLVKPQDIRLEGTGLAIQYQVPHILFYSYIALDTFKYDDIIDSICRYAIYIIRIVTSLLLF